MNLAERLERLRKAQSFTWKELGEQLGLSRTGLSYLRSGMRKLGAKKERRLRELETAAGIRDFEREELERVSAAAALAKKRGDPSQFDMILGELHKAPQAEREMDIWKGRAELAERRLADLKSGMRQLLDRDSQFPPDPPPKPSSKMPSYVTTAAEHVSEMVSKKLKP